LHDSPESRLSWSSVAALLCRLPHYFYISMTYVLLHYYVCRGVALPHCYVDCQLLLHYYDIRFVTLLCVSWSSIATLLCRLPHYFFITMTYVLIH
jgi:hypothetical protein